MRQQQREQDDEGPPPPPQSFGGDLGSDGGDNFGVGGALLPPSTSSSAPSPRGRAETWSAGMTTTSTSEASGGAPPPPPLVTSASSHSDGDQHPHHARGDPHADAECPRWSEVLKSPSSSPTFSPSLPVGTSLHGLGLTVAVDRAKSASRANKRCASLFSDVSSLHDTFSSAVLTAVRVHTASTSTSLKNRNGQHGMDRLAREVGACLVSFGKQEQGLAICLKGSVARPLAAGSDSLGEAVPGIFARYANTREECRTARAEAARRRRAYVKAMGEAEVAIAEMQRVHAKQQQNRDQTAEEASGDDDPSGPPPPPSASATTPSSSAKPPPPPPPQSPAVNGGSDDPPPPPATPRSERPPSSSFASPFNSKSNKMIGGGGDQPFSRASWDGALLKRRFASWNPQKVGGIPGSGPGGSSGGGGPSTTDTVNDRVVRALNAVRTEEARYREAVEKENRSVDRSVTMEGMGLESLQKLEEERLQFFVETLGRLLQADKGALDNMSLSLRRFSEDYPMSPPEEEAASPPRPPSPPSMIKSTSSPAFFVKKASASSSTANSTSQQQQQQSDGGGGGGPTSSSSSSSSNSAVSVARSLDLPEEVGRLRDEFRDNMSRRTDRFVATRALSQFVEDLAAGAEAFASGLRARISAEGYDASLPASSKSSTPTSSASSSSQQNAKINADPLAASLKQVEGPRCLRCWDAVVESLINCAAAASGLAAELRAHNQEHLGKLILTMERDIKALREGEDARWKRLCDAARNEQRTRTRLEQYSSELARARERLEAVERTDGKVEEEASSSSTTTTTTPAATASSSSSSSSMANKNMNPAMSKALGNMFSILPGRGEEAMAKMLTTKQRQAIAKTNVDEAQVKEAREKKVLVATSANKDAAISSYTSVANAIDETFGREEMEGWGKAREAFNGIIESFLNFRSLRYSSLIPATDVVRRVGKTAPADTARWTTKMQKKLSKHCKAAENDDGEFDREFPPKSTSIRSHDDGFMLSVKLEESDTVYKLISLVMGEGIDQPEETSMLSPVKESIAETPDAAFDDSGANVDTNSDQPDVNSSARSIKRSTSAPVAVEQGSWQLSADTSELLSLAAALKEPDLGGDAAVDDDMNEKQDDVQEPEQVQAQTQAHASKNSETDLFLVHFWDDVGEGDDASTAPPTVIDSFSCAYWPKNDEGYISPLLHGRMFITASALYFIGWGGKKIVLKWEDVASVNKDTTVNGLVDNALRIMCSTEEGETSYFFGSFAFREKAFQILNQLMTVSHSLKEIAGDNKKDKKKLPNVPPDKTLKKMEVLFERKLRGVSIQQFYEICWSEGNNTDAAPFYGPYLLSSGNHDVHVGSWEFGEGGKGFVKDWCGETYDQKRDVTFKYKRTTHLYMGPPIAGVTQTHHVRVEGNDKCVLSMTIKMDGIPYADTFCVEVRWVARRVETNDIQVEVGIFVDFKKPSMFKKQIRSGTVTESKPAHLDLFESARKACASLGGTADADEEKKEEMDGTETVMIELEEEKQPFDPLRMLKAIEVRKVGYFCVGAIVLLILVSGYGRNPGYSQVVPDGMLASKADVDDLSRKVDELGEKIEELHETLKHVLNIQSSCSVHLKSGLTEDDGRLPLDAV